MTPRFGELRRLCAAALRSGLSRVEPVVIVPRSRRANAGGQAQSGRLLDRRLQRSGPRRARQPFGLRPRRRNIGRRFRLGRRNGGVVRAARRARGPSSAGRLRAAEALRRGRGEPRLDPRPRRRRALSDDLRAEPGAILAAPSPLTHFRNYVRLDDRTTARLRDSLAHDVVAPTADVVQLKGDILHRSYGDFAHILTKTIGCRQLRRGEGVRAEPRRLPSHGVRVPFPVLQVRLPPPPHLRRRADGLAYAAALAMGRRSRIFILTGW